MSKLIYENVYNAKKPRKFLLIKLTLLFFILLFFSILISFFIFNKSQNQEIVNNGIQLSEVIKNKDLKTIYSSNDNIHPDEVINFTKFHNNKNEIVWDKIGVDYENLTDKTARLISKDDNVYVGFVDVVYEVDKVKNIKSFFNNQSSIFIGTFYLNQFDGKDKLKNKIIDRMKIKFREIDFESTEITIPQQKEELAFLFGKLKYSGLIEMKFKTSFEVPDLEDVLEDKDLGQIIFIENLDDKNLNHNLIKNHIKEKNPEINVDALYVELEPQKDEETGEKWYDNEAAIIGDGVQYRSWVKVTFVGIIQMDIVKDLEFTDLGEIELRIGEENITDSVFMQHIFDFYKEKQKPKVAYRISQIIEIKNPSELNEKSKSLILKGKEYVESDRISPVYINEVEIKFSFLKQLKNN